MPQPRPLVLIDVDGTINPCNVEAVLRARLPDLRTDPRAHLGVSASIWQAITDLPADKQWLSAWCLTPGKAAEHMRLVGLDADEVDEEQLPLRADTLAWKLATVSRALRSRPRVVLLDDDAELHEALLGHPLARRLIAVCPSTEIGLTHQDLQRVRDELQATTP